MRLYKSAELSCEEAIANDSMRIVLISTGSLKEIRIRLLSRSIRSNCSTTEGTVSAEKLDT